ncbi:hypothetical protein [Candidatus Roseilinea sp. NK_OTU-006]|jgi:hypothetical protein|uniref:hypothetical protein n=1 Tax=Candidatus Roseilinea sp. NK_OTU-006 TaxID=2704250 RepID=UPI00145CDFE0|nr:hypothetical protein [Candidatus Roseilinea sp. NK_OTU-006]
MSQLSSLISVAVWRNLVEKHHSGNDDDFAESISRFLANDIDRVAVMKQALRGKDRATAVYVLPRLPVSELQELFEELVFLASFSHGAVQAVRNVILSLPREWILDRIEDAAEPLLVNGTYDEYRRLLELYMDMDRHRAKKLALRAAASHDNDIKETGEDFLRRLGETERPDEAT